MNILIIGYGRMGRLIERTALDQGDAISGTVDIGNLGDLAALGRTADVAIDFSAPAALPAVAEFVRASGTPLLSGVTGLSPEQLAVFGELGRYAPVVHSANYSLGIAVFRRALEEVSGVLGDFDIEIVETHHNQKADAPSGTAKLLLDAVDPQHKRKPVYGRRGITGPREKKEIGMHSLRGGTEAGTHTVSFFGPDEVFEITHRASSRQIFVNGALHAARRLIHMPKGRYALEDILFGGTKA